MKRFNKIALLLDHDEGGSVGLIVNRRFRATLSDAIPDLEQPEADRHPVFFGGPLGSHRVFMLLRNDKPDQSLGRIPNENYAREILQLFTIGLLELNPDGTPVLDGAGRTALVLVVSASRN